MNSSLFLLLPLLSASALSPFAAPAGQDPEKPIIIENDDAVITRSAAVQIMPLVLADEDGDGAIRIEGNGLFVDFTGARLEGAPAGTDPDQMVGTGVFIRGKNITVKGLDVSGYKVGIHAVESEGLVLVGCDVSDNFAQRLKSTPAAEDSSDWLYPHDNDQRQWATHYGAGILVERSDDIIVESCRARRTQNGLILDRVNESRIYDNDFSFLSGWGIAMWRSCRNTICRNQTDFCVRGYSHGIYNRGQDSAGILMFEQCQENVIAQNSATHGGDGFFGFAGNEALGAVPPPNDDFDYKYQGNRRNIITMNDFSFAAAHGIEMTFSVGNKFIDNRLKENAICGIWAGYSKASIIESNRIIRNGFPGAGIEHGGVNIEHGTENRIIRNTFKGNRCGVHLWWDADEHLIHLPWCEVNGHESTDNYILQNTFEGEPVAIRLRNTLATEILDNRYEDVGTILETDDMMQVATAPVVMPSPEKPGVELFGKQRTLLARRHLEGRENIVLGEWGPYDHESPLLHRVADRRTDRGRVQVWRVFGATLVTADAASESEVLVEPVPGEVPEGAGPLALAPPGEILVSAPLGGFAAYRLRATVQPLDENAAPVVLEAEGFLLSTTWNARAFRYETDPRTDLEAWHAEAADAIPFTVSDLALRFGGAGPSQIPGAPDALVAAALDGNHFGILASTEVSLPAGKWRIATTSDDGIRVWVDDALVIDDWTHHAPTPHEVELEFAEAGAHTVRVEYFELDGHAELRVGFEAVD